MATKAMEAARGEESMWRDFPAMTGYFAPGIVPLLRYLGLDSKRVMREFGKLVGGDAAEKLSNLTADQVLEELSRVWEEQGIGTLTVLTREPLVLEISNCSVCGQLQGTGEMFECAFHEGFFEGVLGGRLGKPVRVTHQTNYEGDAGTWCRRLAVDSQ